MERIWERELALIPASLRFDASESWVPARIRDYSPLGFGVVLRSEAEAADAFTVGDPAQLKFAIPGEKEILIPCSVENRSREGDSIRVGLARTDFWTADTGTSALEYKVLWDDSLALTARIPNPFLFDEWASARLVGLTSDRSWIFQSADMALLLLPGLPVRIAFDLPLVGDGICPGEILWTRVDGFHSLLFAVKWSRIPFEVSNALGEHLLQAGACHPRELPALGIRLKEFKERLRFVAVETEEELSQVAALRKRAYLEAGKAGSDHPEEHWAVRPDPHTRVLAAYHGNVLAGTVTLGFAQDAVPLRTERQFPGSRCTYPLPPREQLAEAYFLCTHPDYRGGDLFRGLLEFAARNFILSGRVWLVTFAADAMLPLYLAIGFRRTGVSLPLPSLNNVRHHLLLARRDAWICGRGMNPLSWNFFFGDMVRDLLDKGMLAPTRGQHARIWSYSLFREWSRKWTQRRFEAEYRAFLAKHEKKGET